ncbi:MAG: hypothetical protein Kow0032_19700 [Methyloligellaceae bacterium]
MPALGIVAALTGYGVMAREAGLDLLLTLLSVLTIWAMPVLMGFAELIANGSAPWLLFVSLLAIGFRNLPMSVSAIPMIRRGREFRWHHVAMAQLLSPTSWVQITVIGRNLEIEQRMPYYLAYSLLLLASGLLGTWIGYAVTQGLHPAIGLGLLLLTPLFVICTMATSPKRSSRLALILGCIAVPLTMEWIGGVGLIVGGVIFGTAGFALARLLEKNRGERP